jgi:hypothetical protein
MSLLGKIFRVVAPVVERAAMRAIEKQVARRRNDRTKVLSELPSEVLSRHKLPARIIEELGGEPNSQVARVLAEREAAIRSVEGP